MTIMDTVSDGYTMTKKSWFSQAVYAIIFSFIFSLIIIPFAFLVAIGAVLRGDLTDSNSQLRINTLNALIDDIIANPFFWITMYLLILVVLIFVSILIGMLQNIGLQKYNNNGYSLEDNIKFPFHTKRLFPFILLAFLESIIITVVGGFLNLTRDFLNLNDQPVVNSLDDLLNNLLTLENLVYTIISVILFLIVIPPFMISCLAIVEDKATYNAFVFGWVKYAKSIIYFEGVTVISLIPIVIITILMAIIGIGIATVTGFQTDAVTPSSLTANELAIVLGLSFIIILLSFLVLIFLLPFFFNSMGKSFEDQKA